MDKSVDNAVMLTKMFGDDATSKVGFLYQTSVKDTYQLHTHGFFEFFYVLAGRAIHQINGKSEVLFPGTIVFIRPTDTHCYRFLNHYDMEIVSIGLYREVVHDMITYLEWDENKICNHQMPKKLRMAGTHESEFREKILAINSKKPGFERRVYAKSILIQPLFDTYAFDDSVERFMPEWLSSLVFQMSKKDNFIQGIPRLLDLSNVTQSHLIRMFKKYIGLRPTEFVNTKRISYASELLIEGRHSIIEISGMCGFETTSHFYTNFRRVYQCTPMEFRHSLETP